MTNSFKLKDGLLPQFVYPVVLSGFFLGCVLLYNPFDIKGYYSFGEFNPGFHFVMLSCIILVCSCIARLILFLYLRKFELKWWQYVTWCFCEMAVMSGFAALYTTLFKSNDGGYFEALQDSFKFIYLLLVHPYLFLTLGRIISLKNEELKENESASENSLLRFYDEHNRLKLSVVPSSVLYVSSEFNYVNIHYLDAGKVKSYLLRSSMKSLERIESKALVRCQRSYFVNPEHVTVLRKDSEGFIFAEMNIAEIPAIPVSKHYYDTLASLL